MPSFNAVCRITMLCVLFLPLDADGIYRKELQNELLRMNTLSPAIEKLFGSDREAAKRVIFYIPNHQSLIEAKIMQSYKGNYEVCGTVTNCVSHPTVEKDHQNLNRVVIVSKEGLLNLVEQFPASLEEGLDIVEVVIWDETADASELCTWASVLHNATLAAGRDGVRYCISDDIFPPKQGVSALSGRNVALGCGSCMGLDLCTIFRVKVLASALARKNATVTKVSLRHKAQPLVRHGVDILGLLIEKHYLSPAFLIEPELIRGQSIYMYADVGKIQKARFLDASIFDFKTFGFFFSVSFLVAALFLAVNRSLFSQAIDELLLLLFCHSVATAVDVSSRCLRQQSRRVLVAFWALGCLAFAVYVRCLLTAAESIPTKVNQKDLVTVVKQLIRTRTFNFCTTGEEVVYVRGAVFEGLTNQLTDTEYPCNTLQSQSCFVDLASGKPAAAILSDKPSCAIKRELGQSIFVVSKDTEGVHGGIPINRNSPQKLSLRAVMRRIYETGWFEREYLQETKTCATPVTENEMHIAFGSFFYTYLWCCFVCVLSLALEYVAFRLDVLFRARHLHQVY